MEYLAYCWWNKSYPSWWVVYPIIYRVLYVPGGAGLHPSTVSTGEPFFFYTSAVTHRNPDQLDGPANSSWEKHTVTKEKPPLQRNNDTPEKTNWPEKSMDSKQPTACVCVCVLQPFQKNPRNPIHWSPDWLMLTSWAGRHSMSPQICEHFRCVLCRIFAILIHFCMQFWLQHGPKNYEITMIQVPNTKEGCHYFMMFL